MGVARQIGENLLRPGERVLGVDDPFALTQRHEPVGEGVSVGQIDMLAVELELALAMGALQFFEEAAPEQPREHPDREKEPRVARAPAVAVRRETAAGY